MADIQVEAIKPIGLWGTIIAQKMVPQSPIGLISLEIGAICRILGHATLSQIYPHWNWNSKLNTKFGLEL